MYYLIDTETYEIYGHVKEENQIYGKLLKVLNFICGNISHIGAFDYVKEEGVYFIKHDDDVQVRRYAFVQGYIFDGLYYENICRIKIVKFDENKIVNKITKQIREKTGGIRCNDKKIIKQ